MNPSYGFQGMTTPQIPQMNLDLMAFMNSSSIPNLPAALAYATSLQSRSTPNSTTIGGQFNVSPTLTQSFCAPYPIVNGRPSMIDVLLIKKECSFSAEQTEAKKIPYRGKDVAGFEMEDGRTLICLPQAFDFFLKNYVGGLHTVYTKLKRLNIMPVVCHVEQVRALRTIGAIMPGVNRCKLITCDEFDRLYEDCTNQASRPGRPPKRDTPFSAATQLDGFGDIKRRYSRPDADMSESERLRLQQTLSSNAAIFLAMQQQMLLQNGHSPQGFDNGIDGVGDGIEHGGRDSDDRSIETPRDTSACNPAASSTCVNGAATAIDLSKEKKDKPITNDLSPTEVKPPVCNQNGLHPPAENLLAPLQGVGAGILAQTSDFDMLSDDLLAVRSRLQNAADAVTDMQRRFGVVTQALVGTQLDLRTARGETARYKEKYLRIRRHVQKRLRKSTISSA